MQIQMDKDGSVDGWASGDKAVEAQAAVLTAHIRSQTLLKLGLYGLAAVFLFGAVGLIVLAPAGRETVTIIVAIALLLVAAGCAGFGTFAMKALGVSVKAGETPGKQRTRKPHDPHNASQSS